MAAMHLGFGKRGGERGGGGGNVPAVSPSLAGIPRQRGRGRQRRDGDGEGRDGVEDDGAGTVMVSVEGGVEDGGTGTATAS
uniref:Uncharacterized protein n=1 Tax=Arundo donax TaxID=35708 RepID=A0A0A9CXK5_ARUDO